MSSIKLPALLNVPPKLLPFITGINDFRYFIIVGGRGSAKSQTAARYILYLCAKFKLNVVCGREYQANIGESVHALLAGLIRAYSLDFKIHETYIEHNQTGSVIRFRGFRKQGAINVQGMEDVHIVWIDEAHAISDELLIALRPTIRNDDGKLIFTMNRRYRSDPVIDQLAGLDSALVIKINYDENPFCPLITKTEAADMLRTNSKLYAHVYLGEPMDETGNAVFSADKIYAATKMPLWINDTGYGQRILSFDVAAGGGDLSVATLLQRRGLVEYEVVMQSEWSESDTMASIGRIISMMSQFKPNVAIMDADNFGFSMHQRLVEQGVDIKAFRGGKTEGIDTRNYANHRAYAYGLVRDWLDRGVLYIPAELKRLIVQMEQIKYLLRSNGAMLIEPKEKMTKSPDDLDSLVMGIYAAQKLLGKMAGDKYYGAGIKVIGARSKHR